MELVTNVVLQPRCPCGISGAPCQSSFGGFGVSEAVPETTEMRFCACCLAQRI